MDYLEYLSPYYPMALRGPEDALSGFALLLFVSMLLTGMSCLTCRAGMYYQKLKDEPLLPQTYTEPLSTPSADNPFLKVRINQYCAVEEALHTPRPALKIYETL